MSEEKKQRLKEYQKEYQKNYHDSKERYYAQNKEAIKENKEAIKEKLRIAIKTCHKKKKTRLKSTKEKGIKNWFNIEKKR